MKKLLLAATFCLLLSACALRPDAPDGFYYVPIQTNHFTLTSYERTIKQGYPLRIYIEGNGNPSPREPVALELAKNDTYQNVIYLARPCQYSDDDVCKNNSVIWTGGQYNREIVDEMKTAVSKLIQKYQAPSIEFVGYDGGAAMALLLANRIPQTTRIITVAGILDTTLYANVHNLPELKESLNPASERSLIAQKPQIHYVGKNDTMTTQKMAERFVKQLPDPVNAQVKAVGNVGHTDWGNVKLDYYQMAK